MRICSAICVGILAASLFGCTGEKSAPPAAANPPTAPTDEVATERAKLSPEDRALVEAQEWCVVNKDERLGSMGPPLKLDIKGQAVFVCCAGCKRKAEAIPDTTLSTLAELKVKKSSGTSR